MLERVLQVQNISHALDRVIRNSGAGGVDGMQTDRLRDYLNTHWQSWRAELLSGTYVPLAGRKVEIPKPGSMEKRILGIPSVKDRLIQQAISQYLTAHYESLFSKDSYGFRPGRNAHQAVYRTQSFLNAGLIWVVELDLEKFFDRVNHDHLMHLLSRHIRDKRLLKLIRSYLTSGIMESGVTSPREQGTPQGSPLSPLLSNIVLHELDTELERRGLLFVRYADDCSVYVGSRKAAHRVMSSLTEFIEKKLKLRVNREKSRVSTPHQSSLLGFSFYRGRKGWEIRPSTKSMTRIRTKLKALTQRNSGSSIPERISKIEEVKRGWVNYFAPAKMKEHMERLDSTVRMRLRICLWKQWKQSGTRIKRLRELGAPKQKAYEWSHSRKGYCRIAHSRVLHTYMNNHFFTRLHYEGFASYYYWKTTYQQPLF